MFDPFSNRFRNSFSQKHFPMRTIAFTMQSLTNKTGLKEAWKDTTRNK